MIVFRFPRLISSSIVCADCVAHGCEGVYGSSAAAAKSAAHELIGLRAYLNRHPMLSTPLMALIEYCGFKFACSSLLPLSSASLRYGSADAGVTVLASSTEVQDTDAPHRGTTHRDTQTHLNTQNAHGK